MSGIPYRLPSTDVFDEFRAPEQLRPLVIYNSQYNIGLAVADKMLSGITQTQLHGVNLIMIGPHFTRLRDQTGTDVRSLFHDKPHFDYRVVNSVNLSRVQTKFTKRFDEKHLLHIVVHDEAHWGIEQDSEINDFFEHVVDELSRARGHEVILRFLAVSATAHVLEYGISQFEDGNHVRWNNLRLNHNQFSTPSYVPFQDLQKIFDPNYSRLGGVDASIKLVNEYISLLQGSYARKIIETLQNSRDHPVIAIVKFRLIEEAEKVFHSLFSASWRHFAVFNLAGDSSSLQQLAAANDITTSISSIEDLGNCAKSCLIVTVNKLSMGERIPKNTVFYDLRARYSVAIDSFATFVQDIGRCAGHGKHLASVLLSHDTSVKIQRLDRLLKGGLSDPKPSCGHPEYRPGVYTKLKDRMVILDAEPQIGKTGAIVSLFHIIHSRFQWTPIVGQVPEPEETLPFVDDLSLLSKKYTLLQTTNPGLFEENFKGESWHLYHNVYDDKRSSWRDGEPYEKITTTLKHALPKQSKIADYGCGRGGLALILLRDPYVTTRIESISGFDIHPDVCNLQISKFNPFVVGVEPKPHDDLFDAVIYCLSLMQRDVSTHMSWAFDHIKENGTLILVVLKDHLPDLSQVENHGFVSTGPGDKTFSFKYLVLKKDESNRKSPPGPVLLFTDNY